MYAQAGNFVIMVIAAIAFAENIYNHRVLKMFFQRFVVQKIPHWLPTCERIIYLDRLLYSRTDLYITDGKLLF